ncbi:uncharacterized protein si:dkey-9i23.6 [Engraulis encrasicolus]|uniref:uncharacterized protein si:dkey-9i23.6 n=1 Tax=Engraulis encrasicolus TaxID=184585 RepID=UPI002FD1D0F3
MDTTKLELMLRRLRKDEPSSPCSPRETQAGGNALSGGDTDQPASSRNFYSQLPTTEQVNLKYSPNAIPKWERRQLFLLPSAVDADRNQKEEHLDRMPKHSPNDEEHHGKSTKSWPKASGSVSERQESMSFQKSTGNRPVQEKPSDTNICHAGTPDMSLDRKESKGPDGPVLGNVTLQEIQMDCYGVPTEDTESDIYEDVVFQPSTTAFPNQTIDMSPFVQSHSKSRLDPSYYRVRKVRLSSDAPEQTNNALITSVAKTCSQAMESMTDDQIGAGVHSEDTNRRCSADVTGEGASFIRSATESSLEAQSSLGAPADKEGSLIGKLKGKWRQQQKAEEDEDSHEIESLYLEPDPVEETMDLCELQGPWENKTCLQRTFTLRDFQLDLGSMSLMEDIFKGEEWSKYLPVRECPLLEEETDRSENGSLHSFDDNQQPATDKMNYDSKSNCHSGSARSGTENSDDQEKKTTEGDQEDSGVETSPYIYAIPKEELANPSKEKTSLSSQQEDSGDVYDYVEYMFPMPANWKQHKTTLNNTPLDFSVIKPPELLDNSMLRSRISLAKKRKHRPIGKKKREKTSSTFYKVPSNILTALPESSTPTLTLTLPSTQTRVGSSLFYSLPQTPDGQVSESLPSTTGKSKPKWKGWFPIGKVKGKSKHKFSHGNVQGEENHSNE